MVFNASTGRILVAALEDMEEERSRIAKYKRARVAQEHDGQQRQHAGSAEQELAGMVTATGEGGDPMQRLGDSAGVLDPASEEGHGREGEIDEDNGTFTSRKELIAHLGRSTVSRAAMTRRCVEVVEAGVQARDAPSNLSTGREGPGDPPDPCFTATDTAPALELVVAVAGEGEVDHFESDDYAREALEAERGKSTAGPPCGGAAPQEDSMATAGEPQGCRRRRSSQVTPPAASGVRPHQRRETKSSLNMPPSLGTRPSKLGDVLRDDKGNPPPKEN
jgi:hypothetical protein